MSGFFARLKKKEKEKEENTKNKIFLPKEKNFHFYLMPTQ